MMKPKISIAAQVRKVFEKNPKAGLDDLKKEFGELTPVIRSAYYTERRRLYGPVHKQSIRHIVNEYYKSHPEATRREASIALGLNIRQVIDAIMGIRNRKKKIDREETVTGRIRKILAANPNAGYADLEKEFGTLTLAIKTQYGRIYKEVHNIIPGQKGNLGTKIDRIRKYMISHPGASMRECSDHLGIKLYTTIFYIQKLRTEGVLPYKLDSFTRDRMKKKPAPVIIIPKETDEDMLYDWGVIAV